MVKGKMSLQESRQTACVFYFTEEYAGSFRLAQVSAIGGHVAPVNTQIPAAYRTSMAAKTNFY
jgi:hypothetical protein